eukprot:TRINITY_DN6798_c0_g1_i1.p1 TRINITY_DN6798_c0_g1~~TRINITY_DN6798_c0_g1_i1.p1  ORF type:complete len:311 (-),score=90.52 TRINITY_DN6798_c0_g1_i1:16-948(-)
MSGRKSNKKKSKLAAYGKNTGDQIKADDSKLILSLAEKHEKDWVKILEDAKLAQVLKYKDGQQIKNHYENKKRTNKTLVVEVEEDDEVEVSSTAKAPEEKETKEDKEEDDQDKDGTVKTVEDIRRQLDPNDMLGSATEDEEEEEGSSSTINKPPEEMTLEDINNEFGIIKSPPKKRKKPEIKEDEDKGGEVEEVEEEETKSHKSKKQKREESIAANVKKQADNIIAINQQHEDQKSYYKESTKIGKEMLSVFNDTSKAFVDFMNKDDSENDSRYHELRTEMNERDKVLNAKLNGIENMLSQLLQNSKPSQ